MVLEKLIKIPQDLFSFVKDAYCSTRGLGVHGRWIVALPKAAMDWLALHGYGEELACGAGHVTAECTNHEFSSSRNL